MNKNIKDSDYQQLIDGAIMARSHKGLAIALMAFTGARANEVLRMTHKSFTFTDGIIRAKIKASKRGVDRWIQLPHELLTRVQDLSVVLQQRGCTLAALIGDGSQRIESAYELVRRFFNQLQIDIIGVQKYTMHSWRHTIACLAYKQDKDLTRITIMLGHKSPSSCLHYLTSFNGEDVLNSMHLLVRRVA